MGVEWGTNKLWLGVKLVRREFPKHSLKEWTSKKGGEEGTTTVQAEENACATTMQGTKSENKAYYKYVYSVRGED